MYKLKISIESSCKITGRTITDEITQNCEECVLDRSAGSEINSALLGKRYPSFSEWTKTGYHADTWALVGYTCGKYSMTIAVDRITFLDVRYFGI